MTVVIRDLNQWIEKRKTITGDIGFVPTMGALHEGHFSLLQRSRSENAITVLSIFVNPTQFNNSSDFDNYPIDLAEDISNAKRLGVDYVVVPDAKSMYADDFSYSVDENSLSKRLCGQHRPGHFRGVLTVVMKLLNLVKPSRAYFGEKDYQQLLLVQGMARAFFMDVEIVACPTVRNGDGLALSSRNSRLSGDDRELAAEFARLLREEQNSDLILLELEKLGFNVDYIEDFAGRRFGAATINSVRLIDNVCR